MEDSRALIVSAAAALLSAGCAALLVRCRNRLGILDIPNERSSHSVPRPRTGGMAIFTALAAAGLALWALRGRFPGTPRMRGFAASAAGFFILGLCEDVFHLSEKFRLAVQVLLAVFFVSFGFIIPCGIPKAACLIATVFWIVGFVNAFNFLDGIDGYAAGEALLAGVFIAALSGRPEPLLISAAAAGFLVYNFPTARIFMGDCGSYFLGFLLAASCVVGSLASGVPFAAFALVLGTFIVDAAATLARRMAKGEPWMKAHRSHCYQRLTDMGFSHARVTIMNMGLTALLGLSALIYARAGVKNRWAILAGWALIFFCIIRIVEKTIGLKNKAPRFL
ncbi:MAG: MraY family glycosyltransferase [Elusimicrobiota bacterium]